MQFDGSMFKYIDGLVENCGERILQEVVFARVRGLKSPFEVRGDADLKAMSAGDPSAGRDLRLAYVLRALRALITAASRKSRRRRRVVGVQSECSASEAHSPGGRVGTDHRRRESGR